jgi:hypothetical protein
VTSTLRPLPMPNSSNEQAVADVGLGSFQGRRDFAATKPLEAHRACTHCRRGDRGGQDSGWPEPMSRSRPFRRRCPNLAVPAVLRGTVNPVRPTVRRRTAAGRFQKAAIDVTGQGARLAAYTTNSADPPSDDRTRRRASLLATCLPRVGTPPRCPFTRRRWVRQSDRQAIRGQTLSGRCTKLDQQIKRWA